MRWSEVHCSVALAEITLAFNKKTRLYARKCTFSATQRGIFLLTPQKKKEKRIFIKNPNFARISTLQ